MSTALEDQFNAVLRPYFSQVTGAQIKDEPALTALLERLAHDEGLVALLRAAHCDFNALMTALEALPQEEDEVSSLAQAVHCYLVRFFGAYLARPLASVLLRSWDSTALLSLYAQRKQIFSGYEALGFSDDSSLGFMLESLTRLLIQLFAAKVHTAYYLPCTRALDLNPNLVTVLDLFNGGSIKQVKFLATNPKAVVEIAQNPLIGQAIKAAVASKAVARPIEAAVIKGILANVSYRKVYFNAQGQQFIGRAPAGISSSDYFTTFTLNDLVTAQKVDLVKGNLSEDNLKLFASSDMAKLYRHGTALALTLGGELPLNGSPAYSELDTIFGDCKLILAALKIFSTALESSSKKLQLQLSWQFEPIWPCLTQLIINAVEQR